MSNTQEILGLDTHHHSDRKIKVMGEPDKGEKQE
jgi:hypothetical protein